MKKIKNNLAIVVLLSIVCGFVSCSEEDDYVAPYGDFSSFTWWSGGPNQARTSFNIPEKTTEVGKYIGFKDFSKGAITHEWKISEGAVYLIENLNEVDTLDYTPNIKPNAGLVTSNELAFVLFQQPGVSEITLRNTYNDSILGFITYLEDSVLTQDTIFPIKKDGKWELTQKITVTVTE